MATLQDAKDALAANRNLIFSHPSVSGASTSILNGTPVILVTLSRKPDASEWLPPYVGGVKIIARVIGEVQAL